MALVEINTQEFDKTISRFVKGFSKADTELALSRAINHVLGTSNTEMNKAIKEEYNISTLNDSSIKRIRKAQPSNLTGLISVSYDTTSLSMFNPVFISTRIVEHRSKMYKQSKSGIREIRNYNSDDGVQFKVLKGRTSFIKGAFTNKFGNATSSKLPVLIRGRYTPEFTYGGKYIIKLKTKSLFSMSVSPLVLNKIDSHVRNRFTNRVKHEIRFMLTGKR